METNCQSRLFLFLANLRQFTNGSAATSTQEPCCHTTRLATPTRSQQMPQAITHDIHQLHVTRRPNALLRKRQEHHKQRRDPRQFGQGRYNEARASSPSARACSASLARPTAGPFTHPDCHATRLATPTRSQQMSQAIAHDIHRLRVRISGAASQRKPKPTPAHTITRREPRMAALRSNRRSR